MTDRLDERKENEELMEQDSGREGASRHEGSERDPLAPSAPASDPDEVGQHHAGHWHGGGWRPYGEEGESDGRDHGAEGPAAESDNQSSGSTQDAVRGTRSSTGTGGAGGGLNSGPGGAAGR
jgi:hypothetical protein